MLDQHPPSLPATGTGREHPDITPDQRQKSEVAMSAVALVAGPEEVECLVTFSVHPRAQWAGSAYPRAS